MHTPWQVDLAMTLAISSNITGSLRHQVEDVLSLSLKPEGPAKPSTELVAKVCHEVNRAYCKAIGDNSQPAWEDATQWQKDSAIAGVEFIKNNPEAGPSASHDSWLAQKEADGWTYGPVKDPEKKEHPCFVPYEQLPLEQKIKDYLFGAVVRALI